MARERDVGGGLVAGIIMAPLVFGWMVMRQGYSIPVRIAVVAYMIISSIPLYFLIVTFWTSGGDIKKLAYDFDRNQEVAGKNAGAADKYIDAYQKGEIDIDHGSDGSPPVSGTQQAGPLRIDSVALAKMQEQGHAAIETIATREIIISGKATAAPSGKVAYLPGTDAYPAVTLTYASAPPSATVGTEIEATCEGVTIGSAGPILSGCK